MEKTTADNNELVDYNEEDDTQVTNLGLSNASEEVNRGHYAGVGSSGFQSFFLKEEIMKAISECGFEHPSEVQSQCIPKALMNGDILCQARSGMGKTCVCVISVLQNIQHSDSISAIVFSHTREMAVQISKEFHRIGKYLPSITIKTAFGGLNTKSNVADLKTGCDILVGTPGRINDLCRRKAIDVSKVKFFVVDECDCQLEKLETRRDIQDVFRSTPIDKQVMMFTATLPPQAKEVCMKYMRNVMEMIENNTKPLVIEIDDKKLTLHGLKQYVLHTPENEKNRRLTEILDNSEFSQVVIYVSSTARAMALHKLMASWCFPSICITAVMKTEERMRHFIQFKEGKSRILIATQVFGRGVDVEKVNMVINYDFPKTSSDYLHRVGRAGRFGTTGSTVSFVSSEEDKKVFDDVESRFEAKMMELKAPITSTSFSSQ